MPNVFDYEIGKNAHVPSDKHHVSSKAVVLLLLLLIHCWLLLLLFCAGMFGACCAVQYLLLFLVSQSSLWGRESWLLSFVFLTVTVLCLFRTAAMCNCDMSCSYPVTCSLTPTPSVKYGVYSKSLKTPWMAGICSSEKQTLAVIPSVVCNGLLSGPALSRSPPTKEENAHYQKQNQQFHCTFRKDLPEKKSQAPSL